MTLKYNLAGDFELDQESIFRIGSPSVHIFQVLPPDLPNYTRSGNTIFIGTSKDETPEYFSLIHPNDGNLLDYSFSFEEDKTGLTVRIIDSDLSVFQRFFSANNIIDRVRRSYLSYDKSLAGVAASIVQQEFGEFITRTDPSATETTREDIIDVLTAAVSITGELTEDQRSPFVSENSWERWDDKYGAIVRDGSPPSPRGLVVSDFEKMARSGGVRFNADSLRNFVGQISDGINHSLHFDLYLATLRLYSSSDDHLILELFFTTGGEGRDFLKQSTALESRVSKIGPDSFSPVGLCNLDIKHIKDFSQKTVPLKLGSFASMDPLPLIKAASITRFLDGTETRLKKLGRVIEACISSYLSETDSNHNLANVMTLLSPRLPEALTTAIENRMKQIEEASQTRANSKDVIGRQIQATKDVLKDLGFIIVVDEYDSSDEPAKPWKSTKQRLYIKLYDFWKDEGSYKLYADSPRKAILEFIESMYKTLGINGKAKIKEVSTFLHKDVILNTLNRERNPLYWEEDDSKKFPLEKSNGFLSAKNSRLFSQPMILIIDEAVDKVFNLTNFVDSTDKQKDLKMLIGESNPGQSFEIGNPRVNIEIAAKEGWGSTDLFTKVKTPKEMLSKLVATPAFLYNVQGANVTDFTILETDFATAMFKLKPAAFANKILISSAGAAAAGRYQAAVDAVEEIGLTSNFLIKKKDNKIGIKDRDVRNIINVEGEPLYKFADAVTEFSKILPQFKSSVGNSDAIVKRWLETTVLENLKSEQTAHEYLLNSASLQDTFVQIYKGVFDEFIRNYADKGVSLTGFLEYLSFLTDLQKFSHVLSVRTVPMFHLSHHEVINGTCIFYGQNAKSPNDTLDDYDILENGYLKDMIFNGVYQIVEFKHVVNNGDAYSEFKLVKPSNTTGIEEKVDSEKVTSQFQQGNVKFRSRTSMEFQGGRN